MLFCIFVRSVEDGLEPSQTYDEVNKLLLQLKCEPNHEEFSVFFLQLFEVILETTANPGQTLTQCCVEKYEGVFALYRMKFDLVLKSYE